MHLADITSKENTSHRRLVPPHGHPAPSVEQGMCLKMVPRPFLYENQRQSPTLEKTLCYARILAYGILRREPCHPAAAKEAKLSKSAALCEDTATPACRVLWSKAHCPLHSLLYNFVYKILFEEAK